MDGFKTYAVTMKFVVSVDPHGITRHELLCCLAANIADIIAHEAPSREELLLNWANVASYIIDVQEEAA